MPIAALTRGHRNGEYEMKVQSHSNRLISVYVTRDSRVNTSTRWALFANYPDENEAHDAIRRALSTGYTFAEIIIRQAYSADAAA
jgi:hypothetical protein